jgi:hypothetical protein
LFYMEILDNDAILQILQSLLLTVSKMLAVGSILILIVFSVNWQTTC